LIDPPPGEGRARHHEGGSELPGHRPKAAMTFPEDHTGELDLADRHALRRVAGLSTELTDVTEVEYRALRLERVVLIGVWTEGTLAAAENSLRELSRLAETAGSVVLDGLVQRRGRPDPATYVGAGKAAELAALVTATGADVAVALSLGATAACVGRPYVYGLAIDGESGVHDVLTNILAELDLTLGLLGCTSIAQLRDRAAR